MRALDGGEDVEFPVLYVDDAARGRANQFRGHETLHTRGLGGADSGKRLLEVLPSSGEHGNAAEFLNQSFL